MIWGSCLVTERQRRRPVIEREILERMYQIEGRSTVEICRPPDISRSTLCEHMEIHGTARGSPGDAGALASRVHSVNESFFATIDEPDKAYIAGFILGNGALIQKETSARLEIILADEDRAHLIAIASRLGCPSRVKIDKPMNASWQGRARLVIDRTRMV